MDRIMKKRGRFFTILFIRIWGVINRVDGLCEVLILEQIEFRKFECSN